MERSAAIRQMTTVHIWITILAIVAAICLCVGLFFLIRFCLSQYRRNHRSGIIDEMDGHDFEFFCAELLEKRGFIDVEVTRGSGDYGVDILAEKDGVTYAIQCKRYTAPAVEAAKKLKILLWDRGYMDSMMDEA